MKRFVLSGLTVESPLAPTGAIPAAGGGEAMPDVTVVLAPIVDTAEVHTAEGPGWKVVNRTFQLDLPGIGRFQARDGRELAMEPEPGVAAEDALPFLLGSVFAALMYQRGAILLHAATVVRDGRAYAFCAPSGVGKSTLAAALCRAGCTFLADDITRIEPAADGTVLAYPDGRTLKLHDGGVQRLGLEGSRGPQVRGQLEKFHVLPPGSGLTGPVPLAGVYRLMDANPMLPAGLTRYPPLDAAQVMLRQAYRPRLAATLLEGGLRAVALTGIAARVPVHRLVRDRDLDRLDDTVRLLMDGWAAEAARGTAP